MTDAQEPVAWAVVNPSGGTRFLGVKKEDAQKEATASERVAPVYWPALTDAERAAVAKAVKDYEDSASTFYERSMHAAARNGMKQAVVMRGLLERLGGER